MPQNQNIGDKSICCISCGKVIAKGHISTGKIEIKCKCGVINKIEAEKKPEGRVTIISQAHEKLGYALASRLPMT